LLNWLRLLLLNCLCLSWQLLWFWWFSLFDSWIRCSQKLLSHIWSDLCQILRNIHIGIIKSLLGKLCNLSCHETLLIFEKTIRATKEAVKRNNLLKESQFWVCLLVNLIFSFLLTTNCLLDCRLDLGIYLLCRKSFRSTYGLSHCLLN
jgi:hypothetical protein